MARKEYMSFDALEKYILANYPYSILEITPVKFKDTDKQRAVYKVETSDGPKCLKKVYFDEPNLLFVYSVMQWFYSRGIKVPKLIPTKTGGRYVNYKNNLFILTDWINGRKCDYDIDEDVCLAARNLGKMHINSFNFKPISGSAARREDFDWYRTFNRRMLQLLQIHNTACGIRDRFSRCYLDSFDYFYSRASHAVGILNSIDANKLSEPVNNYNTICHLDYVNKNLIIDDKNDVYVIDFDKSKIDIPIHDIGTFLKRILKRNNTSWSYEILLLTLNNYEKERKLDPAEILGLFAFLEFPQKYWKISRDYFSNKDECNRKLFLDMLSRASSQKEDHNQFCNKFQNYIESRLSIKL